MIVALHALKAETVAFHVHVMPQAETAAAVRAVAPPLSLTLCPTTWWGVSHVYHDPVATSLCNIA